jgi:hypothetical protein
MTLEYARDVAMNDVEIAWEEPHATSWQTGLVVNQVEDLLLDGARIDAVPGSNQPVLQLNDADGVLVRQSRVGSVHVTGKSKSVRVMETEAKVSADPGVAPVIVR